MIKTLYRLGAYMGRCKWLLLCRTVGSQRTAVARFLYSLVARGTHTAKHRELLFPTSSFLWLSYQLFQPTQ